MDPDAPADVRYRALAEPARRKILLHLKEAGSPCDVITLSDALGLHPNTVRGHLELLEMAGLVDRTTRQTRRPGRPPLLYSARSAVTDPEARAYRILAEMLSSTLSATAPDPSAAAEAAGTTWGRTHAQEHPRDTDPIGSLIGMLEEMGFEHEVTVDGARLQLDLVGCPYRDLATRNREVICALHLGVMRGAGEAVGVEVEELQPFLEPSLCRSVVVAAAPGR